MEPKLNTTSISDIREGIAMSIPKTQPVLERKSQKKTKIDTSTRYLQVGNFLCEY